MIQPKETEYAVDVNGNPLKSIPATVFVKRMSIQECVPGNAAPGTAFAPQGLVYTLSLDNFVAQHVLLPGDVLDLAPSEIQGSPGGRVLGVPTIPMPGQANRPADTLVKLQSFTAVATTVKVREWV